MFDSGEIISPFVSNSRRTNSILRQPTSTPAAAFHMFRKFMSSFDIIFGFINSSLCSYRHIFPSLPFDRRLVGVSFQHAPHRKTQINAPPFGFAVVSVIIHSALTDLYWILYSYSQKITKKKPHTEQKASDEDWERSPPGVCSA